MSPTRPRTATALGCALAVALMVPAVVPAAAGAPAAAGTATISALSAAPEQGRAVRPAADVRDPSVRQVRLTAVDSSVLASAPAPDAHASGSVGALALRRHLRPAAAASIRISSAAALVAVTADAPFAEGSQVQVRVRERARGWSPWTTLDTEGEHAPDPGGTEARRARIGSDPLLTRNATRAQVRIDTPSGRLPRGVRLTLVHAPAAASDAALPVRSSTAPSSSPGMTGLAALSSTSVGALATTGRPAIITRAQWGANESWRSRSPRYTDAIRAGFVHHTASTSNYTAAQAAAQVRAIYAYHTKSLGHSDIDYNFLVDRFGRLFEGRAGGIDRPVLGGHTAGFNEHTFAVSALGNFQTFSPAAADMARMRDSIARLFAWKLGMYGVNPLGTATMVSAGYTKPTRYPKGTVARIPVMSSHLTTSFTSCPGKYLQAQMPAIRALAAKYSHVVVSAAVPSADGFQVGSRNSVSFTARAAEAVDWRAELLSPCSDTPLRTWSGTAPAESPISFDWDLRDGSGAAVLPATYTVRMSGTTPGGDPVASIESAVTLTPAPGGSWGPCASASRVAGATSAASSVLWGRLADDDARTVVLTGRATDSAASLAASLVAAPLARSLGVPLLQTPAGSLAPEVANDLTRRGANEVIVVGGTSVVSSTVLSKVGALGPAVTRLSGTGDAGTAAAVAARMGGTRAVIVAPGAAPAHSLAGAALAAHRRVPLVLATATGLPAASLQALEGRSSVTVAAPSGISDAELAPGLTGRTWDRVSGADEVSASLAIAGRFGSGSRTVTLMPTDPADWTAAAVAAGAGAPIVFTSAMGLADSTGTYLEGAGLRGALTPAESAALPDTVLGQASRAVAGQPWSPPVVGVPVVPTATRKVAGANAAPEPVLKGRSLTVRAAVRAKYTDGRWRPAPAGEAFTVQFKASGATRYMTVATGRTTAGQASAKVRARASGRWRVVVGTTRSPSDYVRVRR